MKTDPETIHHFLMETRDCAIQMMQNAAYIQKELPALTMPDSLRAQILETCDELIGTKHDLIHDIFEIGELLDGSPDTALLKRRIETIRGMIGMSNVAFHGCVEAVETAITTGEADFLVSLLLTESGFNILNAVPTYPDLEEETEEDVDDDEPEEESDSNADCFGFYTEDSWPIGNLTSAIRGLGERQELDPETRENLRVFLFAMERLPLITPGIRMSLGLRLEQGGESDWIEIRMEDEEFSLGRGTWEDGDAKTEIVFEVSPGCRDGDAFAASQFAESFAACAEDVCREVVIENHVVEPFTLWDLPLVKFLWGKLPCSFL